MNTTIKTIGAAVVLTMAMGASAAVSYNQAVGIGGIVWYSANCEEVNQQTANYIYDKQTENGYTSAEFVRVPGFMDGFGVAKDQGCYGTKEIFKSTGTYNVFFG